MKNLTIEKIKELKEVYTHAGIFHADDVFSSALLKMINKDIKIIRTFNPPSNDDNLVYDIGGGDFDHHGEHEYREIREVLVPYAAFGKLWRAIGLEFCCGEKSIWKSIDENFVSEIDWTDCCGQKAHPNLLSSSIASLNPSFLDVKKCKDGEENILRDKRFDIAVDTAIIFLTSIIESAFSKYQCSEAVANRDIDNHIICMDEYMPWRDYVLSHNKDVGEDAENAVWYVIYPSMRGGFNIEAIPSSDEDKFYVCPVPLLYWGSPEECLPVGITFVHATGFLTSTVDKETALRYATLWVESHKKDLIEKYA